MAPNEEQWPWACPACGSALTRDGPTRLVCSDEGVVYERVDGIWRMLTAEDAARFARFVEEYDVVREAEAWGSERAAYYRALPYRDLSGRHPYIWKVRARSFRALLMEVVRPLAAERGRPLRVVDAGAGNGWMAYRLAEAGHRVLATDVRTGRSDGLGAHVWYGEEAAFTPVQASFEEVPLLDGTADLVVFAGAFHYATNYEATLAEAERLLAAGGAVVIMETPVFRKARSGEQMAEELHGRLRAEHGIGADALDHENYLTEERLEALGRRLGLRWRRFAPFYGWRWFIAPWLARLRGEREPARFYLHVGTRGSV